MTSSQATCWEPAHHEPACGAQTYKVVAVTTLRPYLPPSVAGGLSSTVVVIRFFESALIQIHPGFVHPTRFLSGRSNLEATVRMGSACVNRLSPDMTQL